MLGSVQHLKSVTIGNFTGTVTVFNSAGTTTTAAATNLVLPGDWNSVHEFAGTITGNTAGLSTFAGVTNLYLAGGSNVTLSMTTGASVATISINAVPPAANQFIQFPLGPNTSYSVLAQNSAFFQPLQPQGYVNVASVQFGITFTPGTTTSNSRNYSETFSCALYSLDPTGTQLSFQTSATASWAIHRTSGSNTYTLAIGGSSISTTQASWLSGPYVLQIPMATTLVASKAYYLAVGHSTATAVAASALSAGYLVETGFNPTGTVLGLINSAAVNVPQNSILFNFDGAVYNNTITSWSNSLAMSNLVRATSGYRLYAEFVNL